MIFIWNNIPCLLLKKWESTKNNCHMIEFIYKNNKVRLAVEDMYRFKISNYKEDSLIMEKDFVDYVKLTTIYGWEEIDPSL